MAESASERRKHPHVPTTSALTGHSTALTEVDWRLLQWLLRYPLQRADDLVLGVARWASRATVYRHVQALVEHGLVEWVLPHTPAAGKRLYYLSNLGLHALTVHLDRPAGELARSSHANETGLLRLLPRLPILLVLQDIVNGLVQYAAEAITTQGKRPQLVRWTWQRDLSHHFQYRDQPMRFFADGAIALCLRTQQSDGSTEDRWYGLFLLCTELDDERLMRLRLERLLCWRESSERWPVYQHMPPVLILTSSPRQCEHWQHAAETTVLKLRLDPLVGALACLPTSKSADLNPWLLPWRTLSSNAPCRLRQLLKPLPCAAFPSSLRSETGEDKEEQQEVRSSLSSPTALHTLSSARPARLPRLIRGALAKRALHLTREERKEQEMIALLGLRLTPRQWSILYLLLAHPLLSDDELASLLPNHQGSVRGALSELHQLACLESLPTDAGKRWRLSERGLGLVAAANHLHIRNLVILCDDEAHTSTMVQRGVTWLLKHMQHTTGIYGFFAAVERAAALHPEQRLCWWETGAACERRYRVGEQWHNLRPDALAEYRAGSQQSRFWLEWDRGTMNARDLAIKFDAYRHYVASREWARERAILPRLLCVAPDIAQERRMHRVAQDRLTQQPGPMMWTTTEGLLNAEGPIAPIWMQVTLQSNQPGVSGGRRSDVLDGNAGGCSNRAYRV